MNNFIEVYPRALSIELCKKLIEIFETCNKRDLCWDRKRSQLVSKTLCDDTLIFEAFIPSTMLTPDIMGEFQKVLLRECYTSYMNKYAIIEPIRVFNFGFKIQKTEPGQGFHDWHFEASQRTTNDRLVVWTAYLNDTFEAGETEFLYQHYRYKPQTGDIVIFPASFTHTHRGNPPINGTKYIATGWLNFVD